MARRYGDKLTAVVVLAALLISTGFVAGCWQLAIVPAETATAEPGPEPGPPADEELERQRREEERRQQAAEEQRQQEEQRQKDEALREALGPFYVPLPDAKRDNPPVKAKGIYLTGNTVGLPQRYAALLELVESTELNAVVIDVKNDHGLMTYPSTIAIVEEVGANRNAPVSNIREITADLERRSIYPIARIVVFKDPNLPEQRPDWAIQKKNGGVWRDNKGTAWVNPYEQKVWDYNIAIAKEAALNGFREIQFDYVRFPENAARVDREAYYPGSEGMEKDEVIGRFIAYAREQLAEYNVFVAADTFGVTATSWGDSDRIGQTWEKIAPLVDYNCPMIYPSHYGPGYFGYAVPDAHPEGTVRRALTDAINRNAPLDNPGIIRPWLQSFTATWIRGHIPYGAREVRLQIDMALQLGIDEYLIWNPKNRYPAAAFLPPDEAAAREAQIKEQREAVKLDVLGRTASGAASLLLEALQNKNWRDAYALQSTEARLDDRAFRAWLDGWTARIDAFSVRDLTAAGNEAVEVELTLVRGDEKVELAGERWEVRRENNIWRIRLPERIMEIMVREPEPQAPDDRQLG